VALQQIRFHERLEVDWTVTLENDQLQVAPLLFVILVENAFKHGIESSEGKSELRIQFEEKRGELMFHCENSAAEPEPGHQPGIGLENLRRRLELLYPEKYELTTVREPGWFSVRLWLKLDD
jgi:LytS/YehU family sensor histidine kinase